MGKNFTKFISFLMVALILSTSGIYANEYPSIAAEAAIVIDYETGQTLYEKNPDKWMVPASMTKMMTAYIIFEEIEAGRLSMDTKIKISEKNSKLSQNPNYPAMVYLAPNSEITVEKLLHIILLPSGSAACIVMAEHISGSEANFVVRMNETAKRLNIDAKYENCHGAIPHYTTARAQAMLVRAFIGRFPEVLGFTALTSTTLNGKTYNNTNKMLTDYWYEGCDGFKTGTIPEAGYCFASTVNRNGKRLISVVMKSNNDYGRFADTKEILDYSYGLNHTYDPKEDINPIEETVEAVSGKDVKIPNVNYSNAPIVPFGEIPAGQVIDIINKSVKPALNEINEAKREQEIQYAIENGIVVN